MASPLLSFVRTFVRPLFLNSANPVMISRRYVKKLVIATGLATFSLTLEGKTPILPNASGAYYAFIFSLGCAHFCVHQTLTALNAQSAKTIKFRHFLSSLGGHHG